MMLIAGHCFRAFSLFGALILCFPMDAAPVDSGPFSVAVPNTSADIIYNAATGVSGTNDASPPSGWDINFYSTSPNPFLSLFWPSTPALSHAGVASGSAYVLLTTGAVVGPGSTFITTAGATAAANFQTSNGRKTLGFRFFNETGGAVHYGFVVIDTTAGNGFPATIRRIVYESAANTAMTVPGLCGASATLVSTLDIDGNCAVDPLTDGLLLTRTMLGLTGTAVTSNAVGAGATRTTWEQIRVYYN
jgi:hypothetical protein